MADFHALGALRPGLAGWGVLPQADRWGRDESPRERAKRLLDLAVCAALLPGVLLLLLVCAAAVQLENPGRVFEHEPCAGRGGRVFRRYRLRTARAGGPRSAQGAPARERSSLRQLEIGHGLQVTRVGRVLRATRLADLPQIFNVIRGDMSLVGPHPTSPGALTNRLWYTARFDVRPGIVSPALVSGQPSLDFEQRVRLDIAYSRHSTVAGDVRLLLQGAGVVLRSGRHPAKRALDVAIASMLIFVLLPAMAAIAVAVRATSPGAIFFRQVRVGKGGRRFQILKFRTMRTDAEAALVADPALYEAYVANDFKLPLDRDPRITPIGRTLREWSLDELPQFFNVLRGDMSLVGPRPVVPAELAHYQDRAAQFLSVLPGVTGPWQVSGRSDCRYPNRCEIELAYVRTWSLRGDLAILLKTAGAIVSRRGAT